ncbi:hypothetical protein [Yinghuangia seranimata]|uniref:hypothetical protein n=1 Tax=Yinghuangia seranimata TaxID=408067 RepID=UPI00248D0863|nr:hypothetical protein [Yinghuangia seranimata]MDI2125681.1 hypothetical protein [Yinghuangia seranimata]
MGQTLYFPVFESDDLDATYAAAQRLLALADTGRMNTMLWADAPEKSAIEGLLDAVPEPDHPATIAQESERSYRPGWWTLEASYRARPDVERPILNAAGHMIASVGWWDLVWPEVPELALPSRSEYSELQLMMNCAGLYRDEPAEGHRVYLHVKWTTFEGDRRAEWLAEQAGLQILGPGELGW